jgi:hypothetical protein
MAEKERIKCYDFEKSFYSRKQLGQHSQDRNITKSSMMNPVKKLFKLPKKLITIVGIIAIIGCIVTNIAMLPHALTPTIPTIDGIGCNPMEQACDNDIIKDTKTIGVDQYEFNSI